MKFKNVKYLFARLDVRYLEDAKINDKEVHEDGANEEGTEMPLMYFSESSEPSWFLLIDVDNGRIQGWPAGISAKTYYKVCDDGFYTFFDEEMNDFFSFDDYVPKCLAVDDESYGFGDYVAISIKEGGFIQNWQKNLVEELFENKKRDAAGRKIRCK